MDAGKDLLIPHIFKHLSACDIIEFSATSQTVRAAVMAAFAAEPRMAKMKKGGDNEQGGVFSFRTTTHGTGKFVRADDDVRGVVKYSFSPLFKFNATVSKYIPVNFLDVMHAVFWDHLTIKGQDMTYGSYMAICGGVCVSIFSLFPRVIYDCTLKGITLSNEHLITIVRSTRNRLVLDEVVLATFNGFDKRNGPRIKHLELKNLFYPDTVHEINFVVDSNSVDLSYLKSFSFVGRCDGLVGFPACPDTTLPPPPFPLQRLGFGGPEPGYRPLECPNYHFPGGFGPDENAHFGTGDDGLVFLHTDSSRPRVGYPDESGDESDDDDRMERDSEWDCCEAALAEAIVFGKVAISMVLCQEGGSHNPRLFSTVAFEWMLKNMHRLMNERGVSRIIDLLPTPIPPVLPALPTFNGFQIARSRDLTPLQYLQLTHNIDHLLTSVNFDGQRPSASRVKKYNRFGALSAGAIFDTITLLKYKKNNADPTRITGALRLAKEAIHVGLLGVSDEVPYNPCK